MTFNAIVRQFEQNFFPLISTLNSTRILVLYGPPCAGKTTVSRQLAARYHCHFVSIDQLRTYYPTTEHFTDSNNAEVLEIFLQIVSFLAKNNQSVICEGMFYSDARKQQLKNYLTPLAPEFFFLTAPLDILLKRLISRNTQLAANHEPVANRLTPDLLSFYYHQFLMGSHEVKPINTNQQDTAAIVELIAGQVEQPYSANQILTVQA